MFLDSFHKHISSGSTQYRLFFWLLATMKQIKLKQHNEPSLSEELVKIYIYLYVFMVFILE